MPESSQGLFSLGPTEPSVGTLKEGLLLSVRNWAVHLPKLRAFATSLRVFAPSTRGFYHGAFTGLRLLRRNRV